MALKPINIRCIKTWSQPYGRIMYSFPKISKRKNNKIKTSFVRIEGKTGINFMIFILIFVEYFQ